jgi:hypothetical protein
VRRVGHLPASAQPVHRAHTGRSTCVNTRTAKKLWYMSKFAAIFAKSDNTQLRCTQPIANLHMAYL